MRFTTVAITSASLLSTTLATADEWGYAGAKCDTTNSAISCTDKGFSTACPSDATPSCSYDSTTKISTFSCGGSTTGSAPVCEDNYDGFVTCSEKTATCRTTGFTATCDDNTKPQCSADGATAICGAGKATTTAPYCTNTTVKKYEGVKCDSTNTVTCDDSKYKYAAKCQGDQVTATCSVDDSGVATFTCSGTKIPPVCEYDPDEYATCSSETVTCTPAGFKPTCDDGTDASCPDSKTTTPVCDGGKSAYAPRCTTGSNSAIVIAAALGVIALLPALL